MDIVLAYVFSAVLAEVVVVDVVIDDWIFVLAYVFSAVLAEVVVMDVVIDDWIFVLAYVFSAVLAEVVVVTVGKSFSFCLLLKKKFTLFLTLTNSEFFLPLLTFYHDEALCHDTSLLYLNQWYVIVTYMVVNCMRRGLLSCYANE